MPPLFGSHIYNFCAIAFFVITVANIYVIGVFYTKYWRHMGREDDVDGPRVANFRNLLWDPYSSALNQSTCSRKATLRGPHLKLVSYSFFRDVGFQPKYLNGLEKNADLVYKLYPGWIMRIYHDMTDKVTIDHFTLMERRYGQFLDFCFVGNLPGYGNLIGTQQNMWRFIPLADPLVDLVVFRDLDSYVLQREVAAVREWLNSSHPMHLMRDHMSQHRDFILAGMWGAKLNAGREMWRNASRELLKFGEYKINKTTDQQGLAKIVWPIALKRKDFVMQHDSFSCLKASLVAAGGMRPFPTCRNMSEEQLYVGYRPQSRAVTSAPEPCRIRKNCTYG